MPSLFQKFKKRLEQGYDQVNVLDGGESWQTQDRNPNATRGIDRIKDTIDANSTADKASRISKGRSASYESDQLNMGYTRDNNSVGKRAVNTIKSIGEGASQSYRYLSEGLAESAARDTGPVKEARDTSTRNLDQFVKGISDAYVKLKDPNVSYEEKTRWAKYIDAMNKEHGQTSSEAQKTNAEFMAKTDPVKGAASVVSIGADLITAGTLAGSNTALKTGQLAIKAPAVTAVKEAGELGVKELAKTLAKQGLKTGASNIPNGVADTFVAKGSDTTAKDVAVNTALAFGAGTVMPTVVYPIAKVASAGKNKIAQLLNRSKDIPNVEVPRVAPEITPEVKVAPTVESPTVKVTRVAEDGTVVPNLPENTTKSIKDLMPNLADRKANATVIDPVKELATKGGVKEETVQKLISQYGEEKTRNVIANASDATNIRDMNGFVISEARKQYGSPTVKVQSTMSPEELASLEASAPDATVKIAEDIPQLDKIVKVAQSEQPKVIRIGDQVVDTATGETKKASLYDKVRTLPKYENATAQDLPVISSTMNELKDGFEQIRTLYNQDELMAWRREVAQQAREGTALSPKSREIQDAINPILDEMHGLSKTQMGKIKTDYLPEARPREVQELSPFGDTFIDQVNKNFGFSQKRTNAIPIDELGDPIKALQDRTEQFFNDNYGHLRLAESYTGLVDDPVGYVKGAREVAEKLARKTDDAILPSTGSKVEIKELITDDLHNNYVKNGGKNTFDFDTKPPLLDSAQTRRNVLKHMGVYEEWGFKDFEDADGVAKQLFEENYSNWSKRDVNDLNSSLINDFGGRLENTKVENGIIAEAAKRLSNAEDEVTARVILSRLEEGLASEQIKSIVERANITDSSTKKIINSHVEHILGDGRRKATLGNKVADNVTEMFHLGALGLNPYSAVQNLTETSRTIGLVGPKIAGQAYAELRPKALGGKFSVNEIIEKYGQQKKFLDLANNKATNFKTSKIQSAKDALMIMFQKSEEYKDAHMLRSLEIEAEAKGLTGREKGTYVMDKYNDHALKYGNFGSVQGTQTALGRAVWQFSQYPIKDIGITMKYFKQALTGTRKEQIEAAKYLAGTYGAKAVMTAPMFAVFGANFQSLMGNLPKGGPVISIPASFIDAMRDEDNRATTDGDKFNWANVWNSAGRKNAAIVFPGGNYLINKLGAPQALLPDGWNPFREDTAIKAWQDEELRNKDGRVRIEGPQNPIDYVRQALGGPYNTNAAQSYFGNTPFGFDLPGKGLDFGQNPLLRPLSASEQKVYDGLQSKEEKTAFIRANHAETKTRQEIDKELGDKSILLDQAIFGGDNENSDEKSKAKATILLNNPDVLKAYNKLGKMAILPVKDPFFELSDKEQNTVLQYQSASEEEAKAIKTLNPFIDKYSDNKGKYFDQFADGSKEKTGLVYPEADEATQRKLDAYFEMSDSTARADYIKGNPEVTEQFKKMNEYQRASRAERGLPQFDEYPEATPEVQKLIDAYTSSGPKSTTERKATERSAWIKSHPDEWAKVTEHFNKVSLWTLQKDLSQSLYEGIDPTEKGIKAIESLGKSLNSDQYGYGSGGGSSSSNKYLKGGEFGSSGSAPTIKVSKGSKSVKIKKRNSTKKITFKKS